MEQTNKKICKLMENISLNKLKFHVRFLKPIKEMRLKLCEQFQPTIHLVIPIKHELMDHLKKDHDDANEFRDRFKGFIEKYFNITIYHKCGTLLTPILRENRYLVTDQD